MPGPAGYLPPPHSKGWAWGSRTWIWHWDDVRRRVAIQDESHWLWLTAIKPQHGKPAQLKYSAEADTSWEMRAIRSERGNDSMLLLYHGAQSVLALDIYSPVKPTLYFWDPLEGSVNQHWRMLDGIVWPKEWFQQQLHPPVSFQQLEAAVTRLPYSRPTQHNQLARVARGEHARQTAIARMASDTMPFMHQRTQSLLCDFMLLKWRAGSLVEQRFYN